MNRFKNAKNSSTASLATLASFSFISVGNLLLIAWAEASVSWFSTPGGLAVIFTQKKVSICKELPHIVIIGNGYVTSISSLHSATIFSNSLIAFSSIELLGLTLEPSLLWTCEVFCKVLHSKSRQATWTCYQTDIQNAIVSVTRKKCSTW